MTHLQKFKASSVLKWVSAVSAEKHLRSSKSHLFHNGRAFHPVKYPFWHSGRARLCTKSSLLYGGSTPASQTMSQNSRRSRTQAQAALLDYLHCTRCLNFIDAEQMSMNSPTFLRKLLKHAENEQEIRQSMVRFLQYHPINEFEPFFESLVLKQSQVSQLLPHNLMFLCDNPWLVENVRALCDYGIPPSYVGKMYTEEREIFGYENGVLGSKLLAYEDVGLGKASVVTSPSLLTEDVKGEFVKVLEELKNLGIESDWITGQLSENNTYDWSRMLGVLHFFGEMGYSKEELGGLFISHPELLLDGSGDTAFSLIALLLKLGFARNEIITLFLQFPEVIIGDFIENMRQGLAFLIEIGMETEQIVKIVHSHLQVLGSCSLKRPNSVLAKLNVGKKRLCGIIKEDPNQLKNWVFGSKISPLPKPSRDARLMQKTAFLERFDFLVRAGLKPTDVSNMIKAAPQVLNQSRDMLQKKIDFFVNSLGFPLESLLEFPRGEC
ncbi:hypothetical protein MRB53_017554 [Persea americana]|uniref:Uncharacterized protein n=1 Tax=Persea americana TaxID=3435 RepID=A0ACC2M5G2_PERAE|nr:hypothetical protein MRB53_017554 [Persea americana]